MLTATLARLADVPRWRITPVVFAAVLVLAALGSRVKYPYDRLPVALLEVVALAGLALGWVLADRLAARHVRPVPMSAIVAAIAVGVWAITRVVALSEAERGIATTLAVAFAFGGLVRGPVDGRRSLTSLVVIAAVSSWVIILINGFHASPLRDIRLYLGAGAAALDGASPYTLAPLTAAVPRDQLPFVYPPFTIPIFEILAAIPRPLALSLWEGASILAVVTAYWLLGVRGRWLIVMVAWPMTSVGIAVGNVASFTFLLYCLGFRVGAALVLSGMFKFQSAIPTLWLLRERRWRALATGIAVIAAISVLSIPFVGLQPWLDWPAAIRAFQSTVADTPSLYGYAVQRSFGPIIALGITVAAIAFAFLARGRLGLARFGFASVVSSPTLYTHGLAPLLAGVLFLGPECLWLFLGLDRITGALHIPGAWMAMAFAGAALLVRRGSDLRLPDDLSPARADVHPAARSGQVWPGSSVSSPPSPADPAVL